VGQHLPPSSGHSAIWAQKGPTGAANPQFGTHVAVKTDLLEAFPKSGIPPLLPEPKSLDSTLIMWSVSGMEADRIVAATALYEEGLAAFRKGDQEKSRQLNKEVSRSAARSMTPPPS